MNVSPIILGVTGGIASGKSTVAQMLAELGAPIIDLDVLARVVVEPDQPAWRDTVNFFGSDILAADRTLDRKKLGRIVFADALKRKKLESFTHPRIIESFFHELDEIAARDPGAIIQAVIPLLFEVHLEHLVNKILVVYVPPAVQIERLTVRDGISPAEAAVILESQLPIDEKKAKADFVIDNRGTLEETQVQVRALWPRLLEVRASVGYPGQTGRKSG